MNSEIDETEGRRAELSRRERKIQQFSTTYAAPVGTLMRSSISMAEGALGGIHRPTVVAAAEWDANRRLGAANAKEQKAKESKRLTEKQQRKRDKLERGKKEQRSESSLDAAFGSQSRGASQMSGASSSSRTSAGRVRGSSCRGFEAISGIGQLTLGRGDGGRPDARAERAAQAGAGYFNPLPFESSLAPDFLALFAQDACR